MKQQNIQWLLEYTSNADLNLIIPSSQQRTVVPNLNIKEQAWHFSHGLLLCGRCILALNRCIRLGVWSWPPEELHGVEVPHGVHLHPYEAQ